jgi:hypothetical protein
VTGVEWCSVQAVSALGRGRGIESTYWQLSSPIKLSTKTVCKTHVNIGNRPNMPGEMSKVL